MPGEAPPDIYLRFEDEGGQNVWKESLSGESTDSQFPGLFDPTGDGAFGQGWFFVTSFQFSISGQDKDGGGGAAGGKGAGGSAGSSGGKSGAGAGGGAGSATGKEPFQGVTVTMPLQLGCVRLMHLCVQFAQKHQKQQQFEKIPQVTMYIRRPGMADLSTDEGSSQGCFLGMILKKVTIDSYSMNSSCIQESFKLNYESMEIWYYATDPRTRDLWSQNDGIGYTCTGWSINAEDDEGDD